MKINPSRNGVITLSFTDVGKSFPSCIFFYMSNVTFNAVCENKFIVKISEFTVFNQGSYSRTRTERKINVKDYSGIFFLFLNDSILLPV